MTDKHRGFGKPFALALLLVLAFALVYTFFLTSSDNMTPGDGEIIVAFLDVGQGDSILIWSQDNAVLIDGGDVRQGNTVLGYLRRAGITRLDYVIATHPHSDHIGGLVAVLNQMEVGYVLMPDVIHTTNTYENFLSVIENNDISVMVPEVGDWIVAGLIELNILALQPANRNINDASIIVRLVYKERSFLFTGDAEAHSERMIIASRQDIKSDVLKIGHHGSRTSTTEGFLDAVAPMVAVIQVGGGNRFGHPHPDIIERLTDRGIIIYRTDEMGTIFIATDGYCIVLLD